MDDRFRILPTPVPPVAPRPQSRPQAPSTGASFDRVLQEQLRPSPSEVQFSRHALSRMESRGIRLSGEEMDRLNSAVRTVGAKGGKESLVLLGDNALVVSVRNSTVVTVVDRDSLKGNVFTNIDSAIIA